MIQTAHIRRGVLIAFACATFFWSASAHADAIDGNWCHGAKRLSINGPDLVTPGGRKMTGDYGRHDFSYIVPAGESGAGNRVDMDLLGDDDLQVWPNGRSPDPKTAGAEMWKRCAAPVS